MRAAATALVTSGLVRGRERGGAAKAKDIATVMSCLEVVGGGDAVSQPAKLFNKDRCQPRPVKSLQYYN